MNERSGQTSQKTKASNGQDTVTIAERFAPFADRMRAENLPQIVIRTFEHYYIRLLEGQTGLIAESEIRSVESLPDADSLPDHLADTGERALQKTVLMKLNGGLGTSMGLERAKSLLRIKGELTFLDVIAHQAREAGVPLVLMNSFNTREDSLGALQRYPWLEEQEVPLDFLQHKIPRIVQETLEPVTWADDRELEWCPPGHGDIYTALVTSGMLDTLLAEGYEYVFVSNADNLGAALDLKILGYFAEERLPFMMEVADRTEADRKGGHLAQTTEGQLILRESAQCPTQDMDAFQDVRRHRYFNTNNLWLHLPSLRRVMDERDNLLGLPMIRNEKTVDPRDATTTPVYQLETAMGSAIGVFEGAGALRVPRERFTPVKTTDDLLAVRSDAFVLTDDHRIVANPDHKGGDLVVELDSNFYRLVDQLEQRFPHGPPSLVRCRRFEVMGDVRFGRDVVARGIVRVMNERRVQATIDDGRQLSGAIHFS
ncbi:MAG: UTP--glucose-1-phosphate uridylyltransferase [Chloroflexota bacterium]